MSFDISRSTFRPRKNFLGVVMQQGRVQLDSDWNEWQSEFSRRVQAGTLDTIGQAVYPVSTPNAFKITPGTDATGKATLTIGAGRYYVDGLLAENHGPESQAAWDPALAELSGAPAFSNTSAATDYTQQPYLPDAPPLPTDNNPYLVVLDVWQRDVTYLEDPALIDPAVNIDTTGRLQTIWQVRLLPYTTSTETTPPANPDCGIDNPNLDALEQPPAARLTTGVVPNTASGPCCLSPNTGFTGQENQLYRVEIHQGGTPAAAPLAGYTFPLPANTPTFKWSSNNACVQTSVSNIASVSTSSGSVSQLTVASLGRDPILGFAAGDWIEITDDAYELNGQPGEIYQIANTVSSANLITLSGAVSSHFPTGATTPSLHTRIRLWDQSAPGFSGIVNSTDSSGNTQLWINLSGTNSNGQIPVPPPGTTLELENGITVAFDLSPEPTTANPTAFRTGDYWLFTARAADGSVETLTAAPPLGIHHHYAKLAIVTFPNTAPDCRVEWPPSQSSCNCACTVTLSPSDLTGTTTLQSIVDKYQNLSTLTTLCLEPGVYSLPAPLRLTSAHNNISIEACPPGTVTFQALAGNESSFGDGLIVLDNTTAITISGIEFAVPTAFYSATTFAGLPIASLASTVASMVQSLASSIGIRVVGATKTTIENCAFSIGGAANKELNDNNAILAVGVFLNGANEQLQIRGCTFLSANIKLVGFRESFFAGIAMAASVSFATTTTGTAPTAPTGLTGTVGDVASTLPSTGQVAVTTRAARAVTTAAPKVPVTITEAPVASIVDIGAIADRPIVDEPGLQLIGGQLQNIATFGAATASTLASQGGTVLAATLAQAVVRDNTFLRLTAAALLLGEVSALDASRNQIEDCRAGLWILTPSLTQDLLRDPQNLALAGATIALSLPLPQGDTSSPVTVPAAPASTFIYTGKSNYTDPSGNVWVPDASASNVTVTASNLNQPANPPAIQGTTTPNLYQNERWGASFSYTFNNLPAGFYSLTLKFAEIVYSSAGIRIFDVSINGQQVLTNFDIFAAAGGRDIATDVVFPSVGANAGQIVVQFTGTTQGTDHQAKISAAELDPTWTGAPLLGSGNESDSALFFDQLAQLAWQGYLPGPSPALLRVQDNEMQALGAPGFLFLGDDGLANGNASSLIMTGNRIDGEVSVDQGLAAVGVTQVADTGVAREARLGLAGPVTLPISIIVERAPSLFYYMVATNSVSRVVAASNIIVSTTTSGADGPALLVSAVNTSQPSLAVANNVLVGSSTVQP